MADKKGGTYWRHEGKYEQQYAVLHAALIPKQGEAKTLYGEVLRICSNVYYDHFNNGGGNVVDQCGRFSPDILAKVIGRTPVRSAADEGMTKHLVAEAQEHGYANDAFHRKLARFFEGKATPIQCDQVMDVVIQWVAKQEAASKALSKKHPLASSAQWVLDFLSQYPPHDSKGHSLELDMSEGIRQLQEELDKLPE